MSVSHDVIEKVPDVPDTNVGDMISRQAAIDALGEEPEVWTGKDEYAQGLNNQWHYDVNALKALPPAQPEIIRCYECKHGVHSGNGDRYICIVSPELRMEHKADFFCGYAKRKGEEDE